MTTDLKTLRSVCEAATPGPWHCDEGGRGAWIMDGDDPLYVVCWEVDANSYANAAFIAAARTALPSLLDRVEALEGALAKIGSGSFPDAVDLALGGGWHTFVDRLQEIAQAALHPEPLGEGGGL